MESLDYRALYSLQDRVLSILFSFDNEFYLTGGTCLHRFYVEKRYSDDLDFFCHSSSRFHWYVKEFVGLVKNDIKVERLVDSRDFIRLFVDSQLQIDFVHDHLPVVRAPYSNEQGFRIDSVLNILSNKLTAVMGRDNPKDVFDIYTISCFYSYSWSDILADAKKKSMFNNEELLARLSSFPSSLLDGLSIVDTPFRNRFTEFWPVVVDEIADEMDHHAFLAAH